MSERREFGNARARTGARLALLGTGGPAASDGRGPFPVPGSVRGPLLVAGRLHVPPDGPQREKR